MVNFLPQCIKCGSYWFYRIKNRTTWENKIGNYINGVWLCNDCIAASQMQKKNTEKEEKNSSSINQNNNNNNECDTIGIASKSDVSPNTPSADESEL